MKFVYLQLYLSDFFQIKTGYIPIKNMRPNCQGSNLNYTSLTAV